MTAPFRIPAQITSPTPTVNENVGHNVDHKPTPISHSTVVEEGNPEQTHFLPSEPTQKFDTRPYQQVKQMQTDLLAFNQALIASQVGNFVAKDQHLSSMIKKTINEKKTAPKDQTDLNTRISALTMGAKNPKAQAQVADGKWGQNTNAALKSALAIANGMLNICKLCKAPLKDFTDKDLQAMNALITNKAGKLSTPQRASELSKLLTKLKTDVGTFSQALQSNTHDPNATLTTSKASELTYQENEYIRQNANAAVNGLHYMFVPIHLNDLKDLPSFTALLEKASQGQKPTQQSIVQAIAGIKGQLNAKPAQSVK